jgi:DHA2 family multidrug resistance protein
MWMLGHLSPESGSSDATLALLIRGFGAGFLFIPINNAAFASMKKTELQQAAGLLSLSRQLGGSFGIAALATFVENHIQMHRVDLLGNYTTSNEYFVQRLGGLTGGLMNHGYSLSDARIGALGLLDHGMMRQAMSMSYNDAFLMMLLINIITLPAVFLLRRPASIAAPAEPVHMD